MEFGHLRFDRVGSRAQLDYPAVGASGSLAIAGGGIDLFEEAYPAGLGADVCDIDEDAVQGSLNSG